VTENLHIIQPNYDHTLIYRVSHWSSNHLWWLLFVSQLFKKVPGGRVSQSVDQEKQCHATSLKSPCQLLVDETQEVRTVLSCHGSYQKMHQLSSGCQLLVGVKNSNYQRIFSAVKNITFFDIFFQLSVVWIHVCELAELATFHLHWIYQCCQKLFAIVIYFTS